MGTRKSEGGGQELTCRACRPTENHNAIFFLHTGPFFFSYVAFFSPYTCRGISSLHQSPCMLFLHVVGLVSPYGIMGGSFLLVGAFVACHPPPPLGFLQKSLRTPTCNNHGYSRKVDNFCISRSQAHTNHSEVPWKKTEWHNSSPSLTNGLSPPSFNITN